MSKDGHKFHDTTLPQVLSGELGIHRFGGIMITKKLLKDYKDNFRACPYMDKCVEFDSLDLTEISYRCVFDNYNDCNLYKMIKQDDK